MYKRIVKETKKQHDFWLASINCYLDLFQIKEAYILEGVKFCMSIEKAVNTAI